MSYDSLDSRFLLASVKWSQTPQAGIRAAFRGQNRSVAFTAMSCSMTEDAKFTCRLICWKKHEIKPSGFPEATFLGCFPSLFPFPLKSNIGAVLPGYCCISRMQQATQSVETRQKIFALGLHDQSLVVYLTLYPKRTKKMPWDLNTK